ncbi:hypothetical protein EJ110_NYTH26266 [Nymphaea thermarum]|nr:hypothetical protein EJ110_NYTH26266 [Nymphaea thermarum]
MLHTMVRLRFPVNNLRQSLKYILDQGGFLGDYVCVRSVRHGCSYVGSVNLSSIPESGQNGQLTGETAANHTETLNRRINTSSQHKFPSAEKVIDHLNEDTMSDSSNLPGLSPTKLVEKPRIVVLGTGWAACRFLKSVNTKTYDVICISPRNHMVFTPLLASTCVGTLEFRSVAEPVSRIQSALAKAPNSHFFLASCTGLDTGKHEVSLSVLVYCETTNGQELPHGPYKFKVAYDKLVIASGSEPLTFNISGVKKHAIFLREVRDAQEIRRKLLLNLMLSENPGSRTDQVAGIKSPESGRRSRSPESGRRSRSPEPEQRIAGAEKTLAVPDVRRGNSPSSSTGKDRGRRRRTEAETTGNSSGGGARRRCKRRRRTTGDDRPGEGKDVAQRHRRSQTEEQASGVSSEQWRRVRLQARSSGVNSDEQCWVNSGVG